jgi:hypothetical protein
VILVLNASDYVLGSYREHTGETMWLRVIPAPDKKGIEDWLAEKFPIGPTPVRQTAPASHLGVVGNGRTLRRAPKKRQADVSRPISDRIPETAHLGR